MGHCGSLCVRFTLHCSGSEFVAPQPWYIDTPLAAPVINDPVKLAEVESRTPMKRVGQPEEVSGDNTLVLNK